MTKGYPIFEWSPGIPITYKYDETQSKEDEISSTREDEHNYGITEHVEDEEIIEEETCEDEHPSDRENDPSNDIIKNQDQNDQEDATIENDGQENIIEYEDMEQLKEIETNQYEREIEAGDLKTKEIENTNTIPISANAGKWVERLEIKFGGKTYDTPFTTSAG